MQFRSSQSSSALIAIVAEGFFSRLSFGIISFTLPIYAYRRLGLSLTETGFLFSLNLITEQLLKPGMGWVADRYGLKRSLVAAIGLRSLVALMLALAATPWQVYAIRVVHGISESLRDPSVSALIAENSRRQSIASSFAWYSTAKMVAGSLGRVAGGLALAVTADAYSQVFLLAFVLSWLPLYVVARYVRQPEHKEESKDQTLLADMQNGEASAMKPAAVWPYALLGSLIATTAHMLHNLFPVLATEYGGLSAAQAGLIYAISTVVILLSGPWFGWLSDHVSSKLVLMMRGIANTLSSFIFLFFPSFAGLALGQSIDGLGKAAFRPAWGALMAHISSFDRRRRAQTMSYLSLGEGLGETIGPVLGGLLWHLWGLPVMLVARVLLAVASEFCAVVVAGPLEKEKVSVMGREQTREVEPG
jgi:MFS family permease